jgi:FkbM family methyltransferase
MADAITQVQLGNREWQVQGDDQDGYFNVVHSLAQGLAPLIAAASRRVAPDATILDVGANLGLATLALSALVPDGRVIAFEPGPSTVRHLTANLALNGVDNCTIVPAAVGSQPGTIQFATSAAFTAGAHIVHAAHAAAPPSTIEVPVITLDGWLTSAGVDRVAFIKLDVEGYEPWALEGARTLIERDRPALFVEFNSWCLLAMADVNPVTFAKGLWQSFRFVSVEADGQEREIPSFVHFAHDNLVRHGAVEDVLLELRDGQRAPRLHDLIGVGATPSTVS